MAQIYKENTQYAWPVEPTVPVAEKYPQLNSYLSSIRNAYKEPTGLTEQESQAYPYQPQINAPLQLSQMQAWRPNLTPEQISAGSFVSGPEYGVPGTTTQIATFQAGQPGQGEYYYDPTQPGKMIRENRPDNPDERELIRMGLDPAMYQIDHNIPLWAGGTNSLANRVILPSDEHLVKTKAQAIPLTLWHSKAITAEEARDMATKWRTFDTSDIQDPTLYNLGGTLPVELAQNAYNKWKTEGPYDPEYPTNTIWNRFRTTLRKIVKNNLIETDTKNATEYVPKEFARGLLSAAPFLDVLVPELVTETEDKQKDLLDKYAAGTAWFTGRLVGDLATFGAVRRAASLAWNGLNWLYKGGSAVKKAKGAAEALKLSEKAQNALKVGTNILRSPTLGVKSLGAGKYIVPPVLSKSITLTNLDEAVKMGLVMGAVGQTHQLGTDEFGETESRAKKLLFDTLYGTMLGTQGHTVRGYANVGALTSTLSMMEGQSAQESLLNGVTMMAMHGMGHMNGKQLTKIAEKDPQYLAEIKAAKAGKTLMQKTRGALAGTLYNPDITPEKIAAAQRVILKNLQTKAVNKAINIRKSYLGEEYKPTVDPIKLDEENTRIREMIIKKGSENNWSKRMLKSEFNKIANSGRELYKSGLPDIIRTEEDYKDIMSLGNSLRERAVKEPSEEQADIQHIAQELPEAYKIKPVVIDERTFEFSDKADEPTGVTSLGGSGLKPEESELSKNLKEFFDEYKFTDRAPITHVQETLPGGGTTDAYYATAIVFRDPARAEEMRLLNERRPAEKQTQFPDKYIGVALVGVDKNGNLDVREIAPIATRERLSNLNQTWKSLGINRSVSEYLDNASLDNIMRKKGIKYSLATIKYIPKTGGETSFAKLYIDKNFYDKNYKIVKQILTKKDDPFTNAIRNFKTVLKEKTQKSVENLKGPGIQGLEKFAPLQQKTVEVGTKKAQAALEKKPITQKVEKPIEQKVVEVMEKKPEVVTKAIEKMATKPVEVKVQAAQESLAKPPAEIKPTPKVVEVAPEKKASEALTKAPAPLDVAAKKTLVEKVAETKPEVPQASFVAPQEEVKIEKKPKTLKQKQAMLQKIFGAEEKMVPITVKDGETKAEKTTRMEEQPETEKLADHEESLTWKHFTSSEDKISKGIKMGIERELKFAKTDADKKAFKKLAEEMSDDGLFNLARNLNGEFTEAKEPEGIAEFKKRIANYYKELSLKNPLEDPKVDKVFSHKYRKAIYARPKETFTFKTDPKTGQKGFTENYQRPQEDISETMYQAEKYVKEHPEAKGIEAVIYFENPDTLGKKKTGKIIFEDESDDFSGLTVDKIKDAYTKKNIVYMGVTGNKINTSWGIPFNGAFIGKPEAKITDEGVIGEFQHKYLTEIMGYPAEELSKDVVAKRMKIPTARVAPNPVKGEKYIMAVLPKLSLEDVGGLKKKDLDTIRPGTPEEYKNELLKRSAFDGGLFMVGEEFDRIVLGAGMVGNPKVLKPFFHEKVIDNSGKKTIVQTKGLINRIEKNGRVHEILKEYYKDNIEKDFQAKKTKAGDNAQEIARLEKYRTEAINDLNNITIFSFADNIKFPKKINTVSRGPLLGNYNLFDTSSESWRFKYRKPHEQKVSFSLGAVTAKLSKDDNVIESLINLQKPLVDKLISFKNDFENSKSADDLKRIISDPLYEEFKKSTFTKNAYGRIKKMISNNADKDSIGKSIDTMVVSVFQRYVMPLRNLKGDYLLLTSDMGFKTDSSGKILKGESSFLDGDEIMLDKKAIAKYYGKDGLERLRKGEVLRGLMLRYPPTSKDAFRIGRVIEAQRHGVKDLGDEQAVVSHFFTYVNAEGDQDGDGIMFFPTGLEGGLPVEVANAIEKNRTDNGNILLGALEKYPNTILNPKNIESELSDLSKKMVLGGEAIGKTSSKNRIMQGLVDANIKFVLKPAIFQNGKWQRTIDTFAGKNIIKSDTLNGLKGTERLEILPQKDELFIRKISQESVDSPKSPALSNSIEGAGFSQVNDMLLNKLFTNARDKEARKALSFALNDFQTPYRLTGNNARIKNTKFLFEELNKYIELVDKVKAARENMGPVSEIISLFKGVKGLDFGFIDPYFQYRKDIKGVANFLKKFPATEYWTPYKDNPLVKDFTKRINDMRMNIKEYDTEEKDSIFTNIRDSYYEIEDKLSPEERKAIHWWLIGRGDSNIENAPYYYSNKTGKKVFIPNPYKKENVSINSKTFVRRFDEIFNDTPEFARAYYEGRQEVVPKGKIEEPLKVINVGEKATNEPAVNTNINIGKNLPESIKTARTISDAESLRNRWEAEARKTGIFAKDFSEGSEVLDMAYKRHKDGRWYLYIDEELHDPNSKGETLDEILPTIQEIKDMSIEDREEPLDGKGGPGDVFKNIKGFITSPFKNDTSAITPNYPDEPPKIGQYNVRNLVVDDNDLNEAANILYAEISNRNPEKQKFETRHIINTALNRMADKPGFTLTQILQQPYQYQGYAPEGIYTGRGKKIESQYQKLIAGKLETDMAAQNKLSNIKQVLEELRSGIFPDSTGGARYYVHASDGTMWLGKNLQEAKRNANNHEKLLRKKKTTWGTIKGLPSMQLAEK